MSHDQLLLTNATMVSPDGATRTGITLGVAGGVIDYLGPHPSGTESRVIGDRETVDLVGDMLVPGLIDIHAHVFDGVGDSISADEMCLGRGTTTAVDAGSAGARTFRAFRRVIAESRTRILSWLHLSSIGLADASVGELIALQWANVEAAVDTIRQHRDVIVGLKARLSSYAIGGRARPVLRLLTEAADAAGVPVMVHIGDTEEDLAEILPLLRPGDVVTHILTGRKNGMLRGDGTLNPAVVEARARGVLFDGARGGNHAAFPVMEAAVREGFLPDTIATDITVTTARNPSFDLMFVASELLSFGVDLGRLLAMVTSRPAELIGRPELGVLAPGGRAEATVLRLEEGDFVLTDVDGRPRRTSRRLRVAGVLHGGRYRSLAAPP